MINVLKKEFRKKLKSETTIHIANGDSLLHFDFKDRKTKKRSRSANSGWDEQDLAREEKEVVAKGRLCSALRRQAPSDLLQLPLAEKGIEEEEILPQLRRLNNPLDLIKGKRKSKKKER